MAARFDPAVDFASVRASRLTRPGLLNLIEQCGAVSDVLLEEGAHFLFHRSLVPARQCFE